jgi:hypothetical protein
MSLGTRCVWSGVVAATLGLACGDPLGPEAVLQLRKVADMSVPITFFTGPSGVPFKVVGGALRGRRGGPTCRYYIELNDRPDQVGDVENCAVQAGVGMTIVLDLDATGGPPGNIEYRFE